MRRHISAEILALYREGAVSARKAARITEHLAVCVVCTGVDSYLAAVSSVLVTAQLPPMPEALAERIQFAIASEALARAAASATSAVTAAAVGQQALDAERLADAGVAGGGAGAAGAGAAGSRGGTNVAGTNAGGPVHTPGRPDLPERGRGGRGRRGTSRRFRMPNWSSPLLLRGLAAAGAVVIIAGAGLLFTQGHNNSGSNAGSAGSGSAHREAKGVPPRPRPASGSGGNVGFSSVGPVSLDYRLKGKVATARALASNRNYTKRNLTPFVRKDVSSTAGVTKAVTPGTYSRPLAREAVFGGVRVRLLVACLTRLAAGRRIVVADVARYLGTPATIVVLKSLNDARVLDVDVVGLTCSAAKPDIIAELTVPAG